MKKVIINDAKILDLVEKRIQRLESSSMKQQVLTIIDDARNVAVNEYEFINEVKTIVYVLENNDNQNDDNICKTCIELLNRIIQ